MSEKLLLHACCGPCSIYPSQLLQEENVDFTLYFFNPNIHPYKEFKQRLKTIREFAEAEKIRLIVDKSYPLEDFLQNALNEPEKRCYYCYRVRMQQTARFAFENGYDAISTTLLGSPYQMHEAIKAACSDAAQKYGIRFDYYDFKSGFFKGAEISKDRGMYRQSYCGCIMSERDRYEKKAKK